MFRVFQYIVINVTFAYTFAHCDVFCIGKRDFVTLKVVKLRPGINVNKVTYLSRDVFEAYIFI